MILLRPISPEGNIKSNSLKPPQHCECGFSSLPLKACCKPHHDGTKDLKMLPDPEALSRARYSSFAVGLASYVIDTTHPAHRGTNHAGNVFNGCGHIQILIIFFINIRTQANLHQEPTDISYSN